MAAELGGKQLSSLLESLPGIASVLRSPVADAIVNMIRAGAGLGDFMESDVRELVQYATRRGLLSSSEGDELIAEVQGLWKKKGARRNKKAPAAKAKKKAVVKKAAVARAKPKKAAAKKKTAPAATRKTAAPKAKTAPAATRKAAAPKAKAAKKKTAKRTPAPARRAASPRKAAKKSRSR